MRGASNPLLLLALWTALRACAGGLDSAALERLDAAVQASIANEELPGAVVQLERGELLAIRAWGLRACAPAREVVTDDTIYDLASLTKVVATAPAVLLLVEQGKVELEKPVAAYLPKFAAHGKDVITVRHLLTHTSGLRPGLGRATPWSGADAALRLACAEEPQRAPGKVFVYSDINFIVLGELVRAVSGDDLNAFSQREIFGPLKMTDTGFLPPADKHPRIAPTEKDAEGVFLRGIVHDPSARRMGGIAGHAGLFSTARDLARYSRMLLNGGELDGVRVLKPESVALLTTVQARAVLPDAADAAPTVQRALGFDIVSPYDGPRGAHFAQTSFGHTGWTGTSLWIDPESKTFVILLCNRNHPGGKGDVRALRRTVGTLAAEAVGLGK